MIALGDITEKFLRFFGITKERVQAATGKKDCGCAKRQAAMNQWGYRWQHWLMQLMGLFRNRLQAMFRSVSSRRLRIAAHHLEMAVRALLSSRRA